MAVFIEIPLGGDLLVAVINSTDCATATDCINRRYITNLKEIAHKIKPKFNIQTSILILALPLHCHDSNLLEFPPHRM
jgi:hypothetical protein